GCNPAYSKSIHTWLRFGEIMRGSLRVMWSFVTLMVITAMYALNYNRLHKNPYPLDAPISKD
ncbi:hypothetical protein SM943_01505, partial [Escherichia coli]|nr:hypothetical protein [Escherichia coli]